MAAGTGKSPPNSLGSGLRVHHRPRARLEDWVRGNRVKPAWAHDVRRPDEAFGRAEVYKVANFVNGPTDNWLNAIADWSQNFAATTVFFHGAASIAGTGLTFTALATRTTVGRLALFNWHGARDVVAGGTDRAAEVNEEQRRCEYTSRYASMNDR